MSPVSLLFLLVMILVGGGVAYAGDHIGRSIGKKKLKWGRLRPKHTAALGTFFAGMLGTLLTILVLFAIAEPVRVWILEGTKAREQLAVVEKNLETKNKELADAQAQTEALRGDLEGKEKTLTKTSKTLADRVISLKNAQEQNSKLTAEARGLLGEVRTFQGQVGNLKNQVGEFATQRDKLQAEIKRADAVLGSRTNDNQELLKRNLQLTAQEAALTRDLDQLTKKFGTLEAEFSRLNEASKAAEERFNSQIASNQADLRRVNEDLTKATRELEAQRERLRQAQASTEFFEGKIGATRFNGLIYNRSDELSRTILRDQPNLAEARNAVNTLIQQARREAMQRGAKSTFEGEYAGLVPENGVSPEVQLNAVINRLVGGKEPRLLVARAHVNSFEEEFVPLRLDIFPYEKVYDKEEVVLTVMADGSKDEAAIADEIIKYVQQNLTQKAITDGMVPALGRDTVIGQLSTLQIFDIVTRVKTYGRKVRVQLLAADVTMNGDPLRLSYRLRP